MTAFVESSILCGSRNFVVGQLATAVGACSNYYTGVPRCDFIFSYGVLFSLLFIHPHGVMNVYCSNQNNRCDQSCTEHVWKLWHLLMMERSDINDLVPTIIIIILLLIRSNKMISVWLQYLTNSSENHVATNEPTTIIH